MQDTAIALSPLYEEERYPFIETGVYSDEELKMFLEQAEQLYRFVEQKISTSV